MQITKTVLLTAALLILSPVIALFVAFKFCCSWATAVYLFLVLKGYK